MNASGLSVDASAASKPVQVVDLAGGRIANEVKIDLPLGIGRAYVRVAGGFERAPPPASGRRALVLFDSLELFTVSQLVRRGATGPCGFSSRGAPAAARHERSLDCPGGLRRGAARPP